MFVKFNSQIYSTCLIAEKICQFFMQFSIKREKFNFQTYENRMIAKKK